MFKARCLPGAVLEPHEEPTPLEQPRPLAGAFLTQANPPQGVAAVSQGCAPRLGKRFARPRWG